MEGRFRAPNESSTKIRMTSHALTTTLRAITTTGTGSAGVRRRSRRPDARVRGSKRPPQRDVRRVLLGGHDRAAGQPEQGRSDSSLTNGFAFMRSCGRKRSRAQRPCEWNP